MGDKSTLREEYDALVREHTQARQQLEAQTFELNATRTKLDELTRLHALMTADTMVEFMQSATQQECEELRAELAAVRAERDEALRQNADAAPLMDAYRDLVVAWHAYDKTQPAQGLFEQLETITNRVALNNAGVAFLKKHEALKAERDKLRDELQYARYFSVEKFEALEAERDKLRAALKPFAECAAFFDAMPVRVSANRTLYTFSNTMLISQINPKDRLTVQHFLDARAALDEGGA